MTSASTAVVLQVRFQTTFALYIYISPQFLIYIFFHFHYFHVPKEISVIECRILHPFNDDACIILPVILSIRTVFCVYD
jgi:hypothetical protein